MNQGKGCHSKVQAWQAAERIKALDSKGELLYTSAGF